MGEALNNILRPVICITMIYAALRWRIDIPPSYILYSLPTNFQDYHAISRHLEDISICPIDYEAVYCSHLLIFEF